MSISSERQLCLLVGEMSQEQLDRYVNDAEGGFTIFSHLAFCANPSCKRILVEREERVAAMISREQAKLSEFERWKQNISNDEFRHVIREKGIIK